MLFISIEHSEHSANHGLLMDNALTDLIMYQLVMDNAGKELHSDPINLYNLSVLYINTYNLYSNL